MQICRHAGRTGPKARATVGERKRRERSPYRPAPGRRTEAVASAQLGEGPGSCSRTQRAARGCRTVPTIVKDSDPPSLRNAHTMRFEACGRSLNLHSTDRFRN